MKNNSSQDMKSLVIKQIGIQNLSSIRYLDEDRLVVISSNRFVGIVDIKKDMEIKELCKKYNFFSSRIHLNKKIIAFSNYDEVNIYDTETGISKRPKINNNMVHQLVDFSTGENMIFLHSFESFSGHSEIIKYNYLDNCRVGDSIHINYINHGTNVDFIHYPKKQILCAVQYSKLLLYDLSNVTLNPKEIELPQGAYSCQISSEGLVAVMNNDQRTFSIIDLHDQNRHKYLNTEKNEKCIKMLFYGGSILVTILELADKFTSLTPPIMRYWDAKTLQLIYAIRLLNSSDIRDINFSPNLKEVAFGFDQECVICSVPFEVRYKYKCGTKEKFPYLLFLLKNCIEQFDQQGLSIPVDITRLIAHTCLETFRR
jgi:hypothetical protein